MKTPQLKKRTYYQIILDHMLTGQTISDMQAYELYKMTSCIRRISELRAAGVPIKDKFVKGNGKRFKKYSISESDMPKAYEVKNEST